MLKGSLCALLTTFFFALALGGNKAAGNTGPGAAARAATSQAKRVAPHMQNKSTVSMEKGEVADAKLTSDDDKLRLLVYDGDGKLIKAANCKPDGFTEQGHIALIEFTAAKAGTFTVAVGNYGEKEAEYYLEVFNP